MAKVGGFTICDLRFTSGGVHQSGGREVRSFVKSARVSRAVFGVLPGTPPPVRCVFMQDRFKISNLVGALLFGINWQWLETAGCLIQFQLDYRVNVAAIGLRHGEFNGLVGLIEAGFASRQHGSVDDPGGNRRQNQFAFRPF